MTYQNISVTTTDEEFADRLFSVMARNGRQDPTGQPDGITMPSFTNHAYERFTVSHDIRCERGNGPLEAVQAIIAHNISSVLNYTSQSA